MESNLDRLLHPADELRDYRSGLMTNGIEREVARSGAMTVASAVSSSAVSSSAPSAGHEGIIPSPSDASHVQRSPGAALAVEVHRTWTRVRFRVKGG